MTRVICRVRPPGEGEDSHINCEPHVGGYLEVTKPKKEASHFGVVLGQACTQHEVYQSCGVPMVEAALKGRDSLLFAYGQTGAGKTFSMYGAEGGKNPSKLDGVVPATVSELFRRTIGMEKDNNGQVKFSLGATLVEIQGSNIFDLLADADKNGNQPMVRVLGSSLIGNKIERIYSSRALTHTIERGMATRATAPNVMHEYSSRSHCFLQLILERVEKRRSCGGRAGALRSGGGAASGAGSGRRPGQAAAAADGARSAGGGAATSSGMRAEDAVVEERSTANFYMIDLAGVCNRSIKPSRTQSTSAHTLRPRCSPPSFDAHRSYPPLAFLPLLRRAVRDL